MGRERRPLARQPRCGLNHSLSSTGPGHAPAISETQLCPARQQASHCRGKVSHQIHLPRNHCGAQGHQGSLAPFTIQGGPLLKRVRTQDPRARPGVTPPAGPLLSGPDRRIRAARPEGDLRWPCALAAQRRGQSGVRPPPGLGSPQTCSGMCAPSKPGGGSFGLNHQLAVQSADRNEANDSPQHFPKRALRSSILRNVGWTGSLGKAGSDKLKGSGARRSPAARPGGAPRGGARAPPRPASRPGPSFVQRPGGLIYFQGAHLGKRGFNAMASPEMRK